MALNTKNLQTLLRDQAAAVQGRSGGKLVDFTIGSILRAVVESNSGVGLWLQALALKILTATRASTSVGTDLDTWVNDFGLTRLGASPAVGTVTFSRFTPGAQAVIPVGAQVRTADASQTFQVIADATNGQYSTALGGYVMPVGLSELDVPVTAVTPGLASNVLAGTISLIASNIPFVDNVINDGPMAGGAEAEPDAELRARFVRYIQSLSKATNLAIAYAITSLQAGVTYTMREGELYDGSYRPGHFTVVFDDGSGSPPSTLFDNVYAAIDAVRGATILFSLHNPVVLNANVSCNVVVRSGYDENTVIAAVVASLTAALNAWPLGETLPYNKLSQIIFEASPGISNVTSLQLNSGTADLAATYRQKIRAGTIVVS